MKTDYPMKKRETYQAAFYSMIAMAILIAAAACGKDDDLPKPETKATESIHYQKSVEFADQEPTGTFEYHDTEEFLLSEKRKGGMAFIVIFQDFTRNTPYIYNAKTGAQVPLSDIRTRNGRYIVRVRRGKYIFQPVFFDREFRYEIPIRVRPGDRVRFGWIGYFPEVF